MPVSYRILLYIAAMNTLFCIGFLLWGIHKRQPLSKLLLLSLFMLLCPVSGPFFLGVGHLCYLLFYKNRSDMTADSFSKKRSAILEHPDVTEEINLVPLQEAMLIEDKNNLRRLLLTVLRGDFSQSLTSISRALTSSDSEASHYAASAIMDITSEFRSNVQNYYLQLKNNPEDASLNAMLTEYMYYILNSHILSDLENKSYVFTLLDCCQIFYDKNRSKMDVSYYSQLIYLLTEIEEMEEAEIWVNRLMEEHPRNSESFRCCLRYYYMVKRQDLFFEKLETLKKSNIPIEQDLLDIIRFYQ